MPRVIAAKSIERVNIHLASMSLMLAADLLCARSGLLRQGLRSSETQAPTTEGRLDSAWSSLSLHAMFV